MDIVFLDKELADLYEDNSSAKMQKGYNAKVTWRFIHVVNFIRASGNIDDLNARVSLKYEKLTDDNEGLSTLRVGDSHLLVVEDGSFNVTHKIIILALMKFKHRIAEKFNLIPSSYNSTL